MPKLVSIVIRGKNEEDWLGLCLKSIQKQTLKDYEIIYIDNESSDASLKIAKEYKVDKIRKIKKFLPGNAINIGIKASQGKYIVILSAHCIPRDVNWLAQMVSSIKEKNIAGVYGRQIPLESTSSDDARDLLITFGNEDRIQTKDPFFHNANSIIKRSVWEKINFDNQITNIEDRDWAKKVFKLKYKIKYDASACVFHFHGLHQHNNYQSFRASAVNNLIQKINDDDKNSLPTWLNEEERVCPIVFYGNTKDVQSNYKRYLKANKNIQNTLFFYYGSKNPNINDILFLERRVTKRAPFYKFTNDILELINSKIGYSPEAIAFADLSYKNFITNSFVQNKEKIFKDNIHFSTFAYLDKGDIWTSDNKKIKPLREMFDSKMQFLRLSFGQSSILRCSTIRINKSNASDGFAHTFNDIKYLMR
jgi:glycosyltransferase involved in cell wall biosynthesis